ncbi:MAG: response regulator [Caldilineaceae bacterium]
MIAPIVKSEHILSHVTTPFRSITLAPEAHSAKTIVPPTLLVAEDDIMLCKLLKATLERAGYRVLTAANGADAVGVFQAQHVDLVILDVMMPVMDGFGACSKIRTLSDVPILMLSAFSSKDVVANAKRKGATMFLHKPIRPKDLTSHIQSLLTVGGFF